jgi:site-specific DNA-methyltransferase (adenine-specific)
MEINKLYNGDCLEVLKDIPDNSLDLLCTDPPYGFSFMGKAWDKAVPSVEIWKECLRVLKPGSFGFIMSSPRQDVLSRMIVNLEEAGFNTNFTSIYWSYATGFPKAMNISKAIDKKLGFEREVIGQRQDILIKQAKDFKRGYRKIKDSYDSGASDRDNGFKTVSADITDPASGQAKELDGSYAGFSPKPAVEVILVVMKPLSEKNYTEQAMDNGKGVTWFDDCRIPFADKDDTRVGKEYTHNAKAGLEIGNKDNGQGEKQLLHKSEGRFPANLLVSDDVLNDGIERKSGTGAVKKESAKGYQGNAYGKESRGIGTPNIEYGDSGSFSRYFDLDMWFEKKLQELPESVQKTFPFLITPKASKSEKNKGCNELEDRLSAGLPLRKAGGEREGVGGDGRKTDRVTTKKNFHPTVKPLKLMSNLVTLGSREGDIVLDPFLGSGTTALAAKMLDRNYIGIELDPEYYKIAELRLSGNLEEVDEIKETEETVNKPKRGFF